jgi:hypothetical protein
MCLRCSVSTSARNPERWDVSASAFDGAVVETIPKNSRQLKTDMVERTRSYWNPLMEPYIYGTRDDIHIFDLEQTVWIGLIHMLPKMGAS